MYHTTGKPLKAYNDKTRQELLTGNTFLSFLLRKANGIVRPKRSQALLKWLPAGPCRGFEIGVFKGRNARVILQQRRDVHLTLVDLWDRQPDGNSYHKSKDHKTTIPAKHWPRIYSAAVGSVRFAAERADFVREWSHVAADRYADRSFDFGFIDGDHSYEGCKRDIEAWWPKIRERGFIGGHDYHNKNFPGVTRAVEEFAAQLDRPVETDQDYTWFVRS